MAAISVDAHRHHYSTPNDLRWKDSVRAEPGAAEIMAAAAQLTVIRFAGDAATEILSMLFPNEKVTS